MDTIQWGRESDRDEVVALGRFQIPKIPKELNDNSYQYEDLPLRDTGLYLPH